MASVMGYFNDDSRTRDLVSGTKKRHVTPCPCPFSGRVSHAEPSELYIVLVIPVFKPLTRQRLSAPLQTVHLRPCSRFLQGVMATRGEQHV